MDDDAVAHYVRWVDLERQAIEAGNIQTAKSAAVEVRAARAALGLDPKARRVLGVGTEKPPAEESPEQQWSNRATG